MKYIMQRSYFGRQPARILLVDLSSPLDGGICHCISETLEQFFSLVCSLGGPCRVPFFGLFVLGTYPEVLYPLQHVRGNFPRLGAALKELTVSQSESRQPTDKTASVTQGILEAGAMFKRQAQSLLQTAGYWSQLELTLLTCRSAMTVVKQTEKAAKQLDMDSLKKVQVVSILNPEKVNLPEEDGSQTSGSSSQSSNSDTGGLVDCLTIEFDPLSLQNLFRGWMQDGNTDKEHLHLHLPGSQAAPVVLKCDLGEVVLNPAQLMFGAQFSVHPDSVGAKPVLTSSVKGGPMVPVHQLRVVCKIPREAICESVLYGLPLLVRATTCWKIDWDELESNQHNFLALCQLVHKEDQVLLAQLKEEPQSRGPGFRYQVPVPKPQGFFLLMPAPGGSLLIKSIAVGELLVTSDVPQNEQSLQGSLTAMEEVLSRVPREEGYNPLLVSSGLYNSLVAQLTKNAGGAGGKRKTPSRMQGLNRGDKVANTSAPWEPPAKSANTKRPTFMSGNDFYNRMGSDMNFPTEL